MSEVIELIPASIATELNLPFVGNISAGFPSPADDFLDIGIDLNADLIKHPASTFYGRIRGNSLNDLFIFDGDLVIIDKSLQPQNGKIAVCYVDGAFTAKVLKIEPDCILLLPANAEYKPIKVTEDNSFIIFGIITYIIKAV